MALRPLCGVIALGVTLALGCSSLLGYDDVSFDSDAGSATGGNGGTPSGGAGGESASAGTSSGGESGASGASGASGTSGGGGSGGGSTDPYAEARQACYDKINALRATKGLPPYTPWTSAESCADQQATDDEQTGQPHNAWLTHKFACDGYGSGQNECLGGGAAGITGCLEMMWAEKDQPGCAGCDACTSPGGCANCDFYGDQTGDVCGHYVNMSAKWFSMVVCGFSSEGGWAVQNYQ